MTLFIILIVVLAVAGGAYYWYFMRRKGGKAPMAMPQEDKGAMRQKDEDMGGTGGMNQGGMGSGS